MGLFNSLFMQRAFAAGIMVAIITPMIGMITVTKRLSMTGEALSHTSLAGVAAGLLLNINPVLGAVFACVAAALCIEAVRKKIPAYAEMSTAIIMSGGLGIAAVLSGYVKSSVSFNSFLFGSIVSISADELLITAIISAVVILSFIFLHREFFYTVFDERAARLSGVRVKTVNFIFTLLTAVTVSAAARIVGALIVSSLMVLPAACSMQIGKSFKWSFFISAVFSVLFMLCGITMSYYISGLRTGGAVVLTAIVTFIVIILINNIKKRLSQKKLKNKALIKAEI